MSKTIQSPLFSLQDMSPVEHDFAFLTASEQHSCHINDNILKLVFFHRRPVGSLFYVFSASRYMSCGKYVMVKVKNLSLNNHPGDKLVWARRATFFSSTVQNVRRDCQSVPVPLQCLLFSRLVRYWVQWLFDLLFLGYQNRTNDRILKLL